ncbi:MAG: hypothetical protein QM719_06830 [Thermomonas sp.]
MTKAYEAWTVQEHGPLQQVDEGLLTVAGTIHMPLGNFPRRMTVARLESGDGVVYSAIALREDEMQRLERFAQPRFMVVPNAHHRLDAGIWKQRYPGIRVIAPAGARNEVEEVVPVDATDDVFDDAWVKLLPIAGVGDSELALSVERGDGRTLVTNDVIAHVAHPDGLGAQVMARLLGFGVRAPQIPRLARHWIRDKPALAAQFRDWAADERLRRIVVSHGEVIEAPREALLVLAESLDG